MRVSDDPAWQFQLAMGLTSLALGLLMRSKRHALRERFDDVLGDLPLAGVLAAIVEKGWPVALIAIGVALTLVGLSRAL